MSGGYLRADVLSRAGVEHGFGTRGAAWPERLLRPVQVHGRRAVVIREQAADPLGEADAVATARPGLRVGVVTADCVPVLLAAPDGSAVAAVHAGWRGLAAGVVEAGVAALASLGPATHELRAALGPHIGRCCYEIDLPVTRALGARFGAELAAALVPTRASHWLLDMGALVRADLVRAGLDLRAIGAFEAACTHCDPRFESFRRDGSRAGRLVHWIATRGALDTPPGGP